jgi:hypothetical protein
VVDERVGLSWWEPDRVSPLEALFWALARTQRKECLGFLLTPLNVKPAAGACRERRELDSRIQMKPLDGFTNVASLD